MRTYRGWVRRVRRGFVRIAAVVAGVAVLLAGGALALLALWGFFLIEAPDAFAPDGDPCCSHPDTWGEVWTNIAGLLVAGLLVAVASARCSSSARPGSSLSASRSDGPGR